MTQMYNVTTPAVLTFNGAPGGEHMSQLRCMVEIGVSDSVYDEVGAERRNILDHIAAGGAPFMCCWQAMDADVGAVRLVSVEKAGDREAYCEWLNKLLEQDGQLELAVDRDGVKWSTGFPDGRSLDVSLSFDALREAVRRAPFIEQKLAFVRLSGYEHGQSLRDLQRSDDKFNALLSDVLPGAEPGDWATATVGDVVAHAIEAKPELALSRREQAVATLIHFGVDTPIRPLCDQTRVWEAVQVLAPRFEKSFFPADQTVGSAIAYFEKKHEAARVTAMAR